MSKAQHEILIKQLQETSRSLMLTSRIPELCEQESDENIQFLIRMFCEEKDSRHLNRQEKLIVKAKFPVYKTLEGYDFNNVHLPANLQRNELEACEFINLKQNLILYGPVGTGKTHLATALGVKACRKGYSVRFYTVPHLVIKLDEAIKKGKTDKLMKELSKQDLLILDEFGYIPVDRDASQLLFKIIADSYETKSLILTTNKEFANWGTLFTDTQMAAAMIDRLVHHGYLLRFEGKSYRMEHALMRQ